MGKPFRDIKTPPGWLVWLTMAISAIIILQLINSKRIETVSETGFYELVKTNRVVEIRISRTGEVLGKSPNSLTWNFQSNVVNSEDLDKIAREKGIEVTVAGPPSAWLFLMPQLVIFGLLGFFAFRWFRAMRDGGGPFGFSKSLVNWVDDSGIDFEDVAGIEEAKGELRDIIDFLSSPEKFKEVGAKIPRGVLLVGPPGTGKTLLARAVAGEAEVPFGSLSGSEFIQMFVGVGASRVRDLFAQAKEKAPCILFIDELDAVGQKRIISAAGGGNSEQEQTIGQLLKEMDGMDTNASVIVVAATNRPDTLDPALTRPGRFDRIVVVDRPDRDGRKKILEIHSRNVKMSADIDLDFIAKGTTNFSGADLANLINEAALIAAKEGAEGEESVTVKQKHLNYARDKVLMGLERKRRITPKEKRRIALHEAGHAIIIRETPEADPVYKVSIIPRGLALGVTASVPAEDHYLATTQQLLAQIDTLMGGRVAEETCLGDVSSGAENDIERATGIARKMVCEYGMSEKIGQVNLTAIHKAMNFLNQDLEVVNCSEDTKKLVDEEVRRFISESYQRVKTILSERKTDLEKLADALLERETLDAQEIETLLVTTPA